MNISRSKPALLVRVIFSPRLHHVIVMMLQASNDDSSCNPFQITFRGLTTTTNEQKHAAQFMMGIPMKDRMLLFFA
jgi:hypothetical protein